MQRLKGPSDLILELRHVDDNNVPVGPVLATGTLRGSDFVQNAVKWYSVFFDRAYDQVEGEKLSFTIKTLFSNEWYGWIECGYSSQNPYGPGLLYYWAGYPDRSWPHNYDLAFETLILPDR